MNNETIQLVSLVKRIDGDRGKNYPKADDLKAEGYCLFLDAGNVTADGFDFSDCHFITMEKNRLLRSGLLQRGDFVITTRGSIGNVAHYDSDIPFDFVRINSCMLILRPLPGANQLYLKAFFESPYFHAQLDRLTTGSAQPQITSEILDAIRVPSLIPEQESRIGIFVAALDRVIAINHQINDNLRSTLQVLYGYWFIQFNFPDANDGPYKSSGGKMVYNEKLRLPILEKRQVASIVKNPLSSVVAPGVDHFKTKTYYATADVNGIDLGVGSQVDYETRESLANMQPGLHTVWFAKMKDSVKHLFLGRSMEYVIDKSILSTGFMGLQCREEAFEYITAFIEGPYFECAKDQYANGATQQAVGNTELESVYLVVPDDETLARFHNMSRGIVENICKNIMENKKLNELRDWLLPMLMNGQATVEATQQNYRLSHD